MGMIVRFPIERVKPAHANVFESEEATVLILPAVRIEREGEELPPASGTDTGADSGSGASRSRAPRH
jgi:hypothetical protein